MLLVDDEEPLLEVMSEFFSAHDYSVDCATEMEEAEALLDHRSYEIVICDLRLNGSLTAEGLDIVSQIRHTAPDTKIIMLTGHHTEEVERIAMRLGVHRLLSKPQPLPKLESLVASMLEKR
jgi:DNA-binding NtrC family response regulator